MLPTTLTGLLGRKTSDLAKYMARNFSNTLEVRREFRDACGAMLVDEGDPKDGNTAGAAFDLLVAARMQPTETLAFSTS